jgi:hypothetical protein
MLVSQDSSNICVVNKHNQNVLLSVVLNPLCPHFYSCLLCFLLIHIPSTFSVGTVYFFPKYRWLLSGVQKGELNFPDSKHNKSSNVENNRKSYKNMMCLISTLIVSSHQ